MKYRSMDKVHSIEAGRELGQEGVQNNNIMIRYVSHSVSPMSHSTWLPGWLVGIILGRDIILLFGGALVKYRSMDKVHCDPEGTGRDTEGGGTRVG